MGASEGCDTAHTQLTNGGTHTPDRVSGRSQACSHSPLVVRLRDGSLLIALRCLTCAAVAGARQRALRRATARSMAGAEGEREGRTRGGGFWTEQGEWSKHRTAVSERGGEEGPRGASWPRLAKVAPDLMNRVAQRNCTA